MSKDPDQESPEETLARLERETAAAPPVHDPYLTKNPAIDQFHYAHGTAKPARPGLTALFVILLGMSGVFLACAIYSSVEALYIRHTADKVVNAKVEDCVKKRHDYRCQVRWRSGEHWQRDSVEFSSDESGGTKKIALEDGVPREAPDFGIGICCGVPGLALGVMSIFGLVTIRRHRRDGQQR